MWNDAHQYLKECYHILSFPCPSARQQKAAGPASNLKGLYQAPHPLEAQDLMTGKSCMFIWSLIRVKVPLILWCTATIKLPFFFFCFIAIFGLHSPLVQKTKQSVCIVLFCLMYTFVVGANLLGPFCKR